MVQVQDVRFGCLVLMLMLTLWTFGSWSLCNCEKVISDQVFGIISRVDFVDLWVVELECKKDMRFTSVILINCLDLHFVFNSCTGYISCRVLF